jgi:RNA polymerase sigma factor (sigma-70 family)
VPPHLQTPCSLEAHVALCGGDDEKLGALADPTAETRAWERVRVGEERAWLAAAIAQLTPEEADLCRARYYDALPVTTIARTAGLSRQTIYTRLERLHAHLRTLFAEGEVSGC